MGARVSESTFSMFRSSPHASPWQVVLPVSALPLTGTRLNQVEVDVRDMHPSTPCFGFQAYIYIDGIVMSIAAFLIHHMPVFILSVARAVLYNLLA